MARLETQIGLWRWVEAARSSGRDIPVVLVVNKMDILDPGFDSGIVLELSAEYAKGDTADPQKMAALKEQMAAALQAAQASEDAVSRMLADLEQDGR